MTDIIDTNGKEIKSEKKEIFENANLLIDKIKNDINESTPEEFESFIILLKIDGKYIKYSVGIADTIVDIGQLEAIKHDILRKMSK